MADIDSLAAALFGPKRAESQEVLTDATTRTYVGTALTDSEDGTVMVDLGGDVTLPDDIDGIAEYSAEGIEVSTGPSVRAGDEVIVTLVGGTPLKTPMVTGVAGEGDDQDARIATASAAAEEAWQWADEAHDAATDAQASASAAQESASSAASAASSAVSSADHAEQSAQQAIGDAKRAESAAQQAVEDAADAAQAAGEAKTSAQQAVEEANEAHDAATAAQAEASRASQSASEAQDSAEDANRAANGALAGLGTLESVIDTVEWFAEHKKATTDTTVQSGKTYYEYDESTGTLSKVEPDGTENPSQQGWYELDETIQNYVSTHVATTDDGLYVTALPGGWRILVSAGAGDYVAGVFLVDPQGNIAQATTGSGITFDDSKPFHIGDEDAFIVFDGNGGIQMGGAITLGQYGTLSQLLSAVGSSISAVEYGVGSSPTSHSDITSWSSASPTWQEGKYVWMRTTTNGQTYTYTCIQGADGQDGAAGPAGPAGASVTVSKVEYGTSTSASTQPSSWSTSVPTSIANGLWLWAKTTYSDSTTAITKSYVGTDGTDGKSVYVQSSSKSGDTTTVVLTDGTTSTTLTIKDGEDGAAGTAGASGYVHTAWANSANGATDFSTTVSANKKYLGVYTDNTAADSQRYQDYSWSLIKGADGTSVTVSSTTTSYTSSTSGTTIPTSGWQSTVPSVAQGSYLWTRVVTTFSDSKTATSYTASRQGANGTNGTNGTSVTVSSTAYAYQLSTSGTTVPTGTWQTTPQAPTTTQYAWTRTTTTYSDGSTSVTYTVGGKAGANGTSYYTHIRYATNSSGANMSATPSASTTYIGVYSGTSSTAPTSASSYTWSKYVGDKGDKGDVGDTGPEAVVTVYPSAIDWDAGTATLAVTLRVDGTVTTPSSYKWTKGTATTSLGTAATLAVSDLNATYNCTVTW